MLDKAVAVLHQQNTEFEKVRTTVDALLKGTTEVQVKITNIETGIVEKVRQLEKQLDKLEEYTVNKFTKFEEDIKQFWIENGGGNLKK